MKINKSTKNIKFGKRIHHSYMIW